MSAPVQDFGPPSPTSPSGILNTITTAIQHATAPAAIAVITAVGAQMAIAAFDARVAAWLQGRGKAWARPLSRPEEWVLSWVFTIIAFPTWCAIMEVPVRENFALGFVAGFASPLITGGLRRVGIDLDKMVAGIKSDPPPPPPAPPAAPGGAPVA